MLNSVIQTNKSNGIVKVDYEGLDSIRKSWMVPRGTGKLVHPIQQESTTDVRNTTQLKTDDKKIETP